MQEIDKLPAIVSTRIAAQALGRQQQTLRKWACEGSGPIRPARINGRLGWRVEDLRRLIEGEPVERAA